MKKVFQLILYYACLNTSIVVCQSNEIIQLWSGNPPNMKSNKNLEYAEIGSDKVTRIYNVSYPTLEYIKPTKPNGTAVIICPGGGYMRLAYSIEGNNVADWFAHRGIAAFVLKYRLPNDSTMIKKEIVPLSDAQQAIYYLKNNFVKYGIDTNKIGIMGFSAGGHLAASASVHFKDSYINSNDKKFSLRPSFSILIYPVITMQNEFTHQGSKKALLNPNACDSLVNYFSIELNATNETPPTFLVHASDDKSVLVDNSLKYYTALKNKNINAVLHVFQSGGHGFAMQNKFVDDQWLFLLENWLIENKLR